MAGTNPEGSDRIILEFTIHRSPAEAFASVSDRLGEGLRRLGIHLEPRAGGALRDGTVEFGRVENWQPGDEIRLVTRPATWGQSPPVNLRLRFDGVPGGSRVRLEIDGWASALEEPDTGLLDWGGGTLLAHVIRQFSPAALGDWITDRKARRPTGEQSVATYRDPTYHWPNFLLILDRIQLKPDDRLLEVACGGGAFMRKALESGCTAIAIDHSPDMLRTARENNQVAIAAGRLTVLEGEADHLPVPSDSFTCCVCTGAFSFFPDPAGSMREMYRALAPGGRLAVYTTTAKLRGTPAAPEPVASRLHFYESKELGQLARGAGFTRVRVESADEAKYAREAGLAKEVISFFEGVGSVSLLLLARKSAPSGPRPKGARPARAMPRRRVQRRTGKARARTGRSFRSSRRSERA